MKRSIESSEIHNKEMKEIRESLREFNESLKKSSEIHRKEMKEFRESLKKSSEMNNKEMKEICESLREFNESLKKSSEIHRKEMKEFKESLREMRQSSDEMFKGLVELRRQLGDLGLVQGEIAEDLFYRNIFYLFKDFHFNDIHRNLKKKGEAEYDIVAVNNESVLVIEVKNKLEKRMVDNFLNKKIPNFKKAFPKFQKYKMLAGMGALVIKDDIGRYAEKSGLYVLTQTGDGGASLMNHKRFKPKEF
ncbi:MAG: hypothetical protein HQK79_09360 [Desulfobacterales bacterium]|nr:hypothetical protein [Desulfobacterales bacterium]MBF0397689.1 hypothetical protein [Desulfobacterales bacterium]